MTACARVGIARFYQQTILPSTTTSGTRRCESPRWLCGTPWRRAGDVSPSGDGTFMTNRSNRLDAADDVRAEARKQHVLCQVMFVHGDVRDARGVRLAENHESRIGDLLDDQMCGFDEIKRWPCAARVRRRCRRAAPDAAASASCTFTTGIASVRRRCLRTVITRCVGMPSPISICLMASRCRDERIDLPHSSARTSLLSGESRRASRRRAPAPGGVSPPRCGTNRQREAGHRHTMWIVRVNNVW